MFRTRVNRTLIEWYKTFRRECLAMPLSMSEDQYAWFLSSGAGPQVDWNEPFRRWQRAHNGIPTILCWWSFLKK